MVIIKEEKLNPLPSSYQKVKDEVAGGVRQDWKRQLVDDTKKKAIYTARTYDDFKASVAGCELKPITFREFNAPPKHKYNRTVDKHRTGTQEAQVTGSLASDAPEAVKTGAQFERAFRRLPAPERLAWLQAVPLERYAQIFKV